MMQPGPLTYVDHDGWVRYTEPGRSLRVQSILAWGQHVHCSVEYWDPLHYWENYEDGLYVIRIDPGSHFIELCENPQDAPWPHHISLCHPRDLTGGLVNDLVSVIGHVEGRSGFMRIWQVCSTSTHVPHYYDAMIGPVWGEISRLRAAGGHPGQITWSA